MPAIQAGIEAIRRIKNKATARGHNHYLPALAASGILTLSLGHHLLNIWERPWMLSLGIAATGSRLLWPIVAILLRSFSRHIPGITPGRRLAGILLALVAGLLAAWGFYRVPSDYQQMRIYPNVEPAQELRLIELKAGGKVIPLIKAAGQGDWEEADGVMLASPVSQPITIDFKSKVNALVTILFETSPQGGSARISFESQEAAIDLRDSQPGQVMLAFSSRYRGIPNWIFIPLLIVLDVVTFGSFTLVLLLLQGIGEQAPAEPASSKERFPSHRAGLLVLVGAGIVLHLANALSVPLLFDADTPAYLEGAVHWLQQGNLSGVSILRGPGTTLLFTPVLAVFGRNPWGLKILLHTLAIICIPLSYWLGWQLSKRRSVAFLAALPALLTPDLYLYSNLVMSDLANLALVLLFCCLLLSALETWKLGTVFGLILSACLASLLRSENLLLFAIGAAVLAGPEILNSLKRWREGEVRQLKMSKSIQLTVLALIIALLPLAGWAAYFKELHGFYSLGNHTGLVLYDGWIYFGDASKLSFSDPASEAGAKIASALEQHPPIITDPSGVATGLEIFPSLLQAGYSNQESFLLMEQAAQDAIRRDWQKSFKVLLMKLERGLRPEFIYRITFALPGETIWTSPAKQQFFDTENVSIPILIRMQRGINEKTWAWYPKLYPAWILTSLLALFLSLLRRPALKWLALVSIVATRIFIPDILGLACWRYILAGWLPLQIISISWAAVVIRGVRQLAAERQLQHRLEPAQNRQPLT